MSASRWGGASRRCSVDGSCDRTSLHRCHTTAQHLGLLQSMLQLLLSQFVFDIETKRYGTFLLLTVFGMVTAQSNQLLANWATTIGFALTVLCMGNYPFHLLTARLPTVRITTLARMHQRLDAPLNGHPPRFLWVLRVLPITPTFVQIKA